jgi:hypothetical protein
MDDSPARLQQNRYFSLGSKIYGQGFVFADNDPECTPVAERERILANHPDWLHRVPPYLVGEEINSDPLHRPTRYVIQLSDIKTESELDLWPELKAIVEAKVKPERLALGPNPNNVPLKRRWWAYQAHRPELYAILLQKQRALCVSRVGQCLAFVFEPTNMVFSEAVVVFDIDEWSLFAVLQCRVHEIWARLFGSTMKDDLRYTPSDCFETFPFPDGAESNNTLEHAGRQYYQFRAGLMVGHSEGLTKTYNRFHDPSDRRSEIVRLRELHEAMDRAVLDAYGWSDIRPVCEFRLDYEEDAEETPGKASGKKKPWRYRWPDETRDEVLGRLLALNARRAAEEQPNMSRRMPASKTPKQRGRRKGVGALLD